MHVLRTLLAAAALAAPIAVSAQVSEKSEDLERFTAFELNGCFDAKLEAGTPQRITIRASAEQLARVRVRKTGGTVIVEPTDGWQSGFDLCRDKIEVLVTANFDGGSPVELRVRGSGNLDAQVPAASRLTARVSGSGDLTLRGGAQNCEIEVAGSGDATAHALDCSAATQVAVHGSGSATLEGQTRSCGFEVQGSGDVVARDFSCDIAEVEINGSGSVELASIGEIDVEIHGSGDVSYRGQPTLRDIDIHGSGRLRKL
jgi:putative autotransporter adhesin-like protein